jgi:hypothetical protein
MGMTPAAPDVSNRLLSMVERIFGARLTAEALIACNLRNKPRSQVVEEHLAAGGRRSDEGLKNIRDVRWQRIAGPAAAKVVLTPYTSIKASYFAQVSAIGRDAIAIHKALDPKTSGDTAIRVRVGKGRGFVSWRHAAEVEHLVKVIQAYMALHADPETFLQSMGTVSRISREFRVGQHIVKVGFSPERSCQEAWAAMDLAAVQSRKRISKAFPDDVALAKREAEKEREDKKDKEKEKPNPRAAIAPPPGNPKGGQPTQALTKKQKNAAKRAKVLASNPAARSDADLRAIGYCLNCRDGAHQKASCKAATVAFTG